MNQASRPLHARYDVAVLDLDEEVGQHGQCLAAFDHIDHLGQRLEEGFALQCETHVVPCPYALKMWNKSKAWWCW